MRTAQIYLAVALVSSAAPAFAAPLPIVAPNAAASSPLKPFTKRANTELSARAGAGGLLKPFLTSAGSSVAIGGILAGISKLFGGDSAAPSKRAEDLSEEDLDEIIASIQASGNFSPEELDQAEAALSALFAQGESKRAVAASKLSPAIKKEIGDFFSNIIGSIVGSGGINLALGKNVDGSDKAKRDVQLAERAALTGLLKPFLASAGSSVAIGGLLAGINKLFGGDAPPAKREELIARAGADGLLKPFLTSLGSSAAIGGVLAGISSIFGGGDAPAARRSVEDLATMFAKIENSSEFTQEQLDEVEAELERNFGSGAVVARDVNGRALALGGLTKGLVGIIGSIAGSLGIGAVISGTGAAKRADAAPSAEDIIAAIQGSDVFSQEQLDEIEAELEKSFATPSRSLDSRALKLGGLTKGLVGIVGSIAGSLGIGALLGGNERRAFEGLDALD